MELPVVESQISGLSPRLVDFPVYGFLEKNRLGNLLPKELKHQLPDGNLDPRLQNITLGPFIRISETRFPGSTTKFVNEANVMLSLPVNEYNMKYHFRYFEDSPLYLYLHIIPIRKYLLDSLMPIFDSDKESIDNLIEDLNDHWFLDFKIMKEYLEKNSNTLNYINNLISEIEKIRWLCLHQFINIIKPLFPLITKQFEVLCSTKRILLNKSYNSSPLHPVIGHLNSYNYLYNSQPCYQSIIRFIVSAAKKSIEVYFKTHSMNQLMKDILYNIVSSEDEDILCNFVLECNLPLTKIEEEEVDFKDFELSKSPLILYLKNEEVKNKILDMLQYLHLKNKNEMKRLYYQFFFSLSIHIPIALSIVVESLNMMDLYHRPRFIYDLLLFSPKITISEFLKAVHCIPGYEEDQSLAELFHTIYFKYVPRDEKKIIEDNSCVICMDLPRTHIAVSCGHYVYCEECIKPRDNCVICRKPIENKIKVFFN